jgi:tetratricopeptide (TPR) repeat protein
MRKTLATVLALLWAGCTTPLELGERLYREGDRLGALETWRAVPENESEYEEVRLRIEAVEEESQQLVVRYQKRGRYFEDKGRLAESILDYRLALRLQPHNAATLDHVQQLARQLAEQEAELKTSYRTAFDSGDLAAARQQLAKLRTLDPFDPVLQTDERQLHDALRTEVTRLLGVGRRGFSSGNYARAKRAFRGVLKLDPDNESARGYLSYIFTIDRESHGSGEQPAAFEAPERFASDAEIRAEGFYQNGLAAERAGDLYAAIRHDLRALRADANHRGAQRHLAALRQQLAGEVNSLLEAGRRFFRNEDLHSALDLWRRAQLVDPENERARAYIARAERQIENLERLRSEPDVATEAE